MKRPILIVLLLLLATSVSAQHRRHSKANTFDFTIRGGMNMCQIDGDADGNYNKLGYHLGVNTTFPVSHDNENLRFLVEIGVSNKGSKVKAMHRTFSATYIEIPLLLTYHFGNYQDQGLRLGIGFAPAILGKASVDDDGERRPTLEQNFRRMDAFPFCFDVQYRISEHFGFQARFCNSLLPITKEASQGTYRIFRENKGAFHRLIQAGVLYRF